MKGRRETGREGGRERGGKIKRRKGALCARYSTEGGNLNVHV